LTEFEIALSSVLRRIIEEDCVAAVVL
jgi:hypothetical protein